MDIPDHSVITVLTYLLPGFITAAVVYSLTPSQRPIPFERVVQALIFTMLVQVGVLGAKFGLLWLGSHVRTFGSWTEGVRLVWSVVLAGALGLVVAWMANTDRVHGALRWLGITCQTSFSSEWYGVFSKNKGYVVLHLSGQRRLYGWPEEWPSTPGHGHFVMMQAEWLKDEGRVELAGVNRILIRAEDVEMVELMEVQDTPPQETQNGRSQGANTATTTAATESAERGTRHYAVAAPTVQTATAAGAAAEAQRVTSVRED